MRKLLFSILSTISILLVVGAPAVHAQDSVLDLLTPFYDANSTDCVAGGSVYKFVQTLAYQESTDNPTATNGDATGKYQYITATWHTHAHSYYPSADLQYAQAKDAPESVQDAVAFIEYSVKSIQFAGNLQKMAVSHIYPEVANDPSKWPSYQIDNNPTAQEYADLFMQRYSKGDGQNDPLKFDQAPDFEADYVKSVGRPYSPDSGNLAGNCGGGIPAGNFVFYDQGDSKWSAHPIYTANDGGSDTIGYAGCGPTSAAMVVATLADKSVTPIDTGDYMTSLGSGVGYTSAGATVSGLEKAVEHWGLKATLLNATDFAGAMNYIKSGGLIITGGAGQSPYSAHGHVVVLRALDATGKFLVGNPAPNLQQGPDELFSSQGLQAAGLQYMIGVSK